MSARDFTRAPFHIRYPREFDFEPKIVSIGPHFYNRTEFSEAMEKKKGEFTDYFLKTPAAFEGLVQRLKDSSDADNVKLQDKIYNWYGGKDKLAPVGWDKLLPMLLRDSFFIIRIIIYLSREANNMLSLGVNVKMVRFDLLLLENQIPLFFLKIVYDYLKNHKALLPITLTEQDSAPNSHETGNTQTASQTHSWCRCLCFKPTSLQQSTGEQTLLPHPDSEQNSSVHATSVQTENLDEFLKELRPFICLDMPWEFNEEHISQLPDHLLDLYWKWCLPSKLPSNTYLRNHRDHTFVRDISWVNIHLRSNADKRIPNACELSKKAGMTFVKRKHEKGFGVEFHKRKGILQLPHLKLDSSQTTLLVNLIAFEEFKPSEDRILTSFILLLDGLINTKKDAELLHSCGVITNKLSSIEMVSEFFNDMGNICKVDYNNHYCKDQFEDLNNYYQSKWSRHRAILQHEHFKSPWAAISMAAGTSLLIMAGLQTAYNIYGFYHHHQ
ncbi:hypothetical protein LUZ62_080137 [Rhynchospora pubera]|uniref:Uncharacterized protein n=1 Tax=Rhynchospora pubera TaxID=906938 RepID=A0AAV8BRD9_9POAL|nr:hypothetical protein LUZ62_080137 [Rhynchospora pubera]